jgi:tetratricopeptide (TPR) repeat protein
MPKHWRYHHNRAVVASRLGRVDEVEEAYAAAVSLSPKVANPYRGLGGFYYRSGKLERALAVYEKGLANLGAEATLLQAKGITLVMLERYEAAVAALDSSLALVPGNAEALLYRGVVALRLGDAPGSIPFIQKALARDREILDGWRYLTEAAAAAGDTVLARKAGAEWARRR